MPLSFGEQRKHGGEDQGGYKEDADACSVRRTGFYVGHAVESVSRDD